jgi:hypothetical protein
MTFERRKETNEEEKGEVQKERRRQRRRLLPRERHGATVYIIATRDGGRHERAQHIV